MTDPITRAQEAQRLLDEPLLNEAFLAVERSIFDRLKASSASANDAELLMALRLVGKIKGWFIQQINSGKIELDERSKKQERK